MDTTAVAIRLGRQSSLKLPVERNEKLRYLQHADLRKATRVAACSGISAQRFDEMNQVRCGKNHEGV